MSDEHYTRYLKCPEHGSFEAHFKTCPQCFPDEDLGDAFEAAMSDIATMQAVLAEQSAKLKQQEATIRHRDELLRIQSETIGRYEAAMREAHELLSKQWLGTLDSPTVQRIAKTCEILRNALQETHEQSASTEAAKLETKFKVGDKVRVSVDADEYREGTFDTIHAINSEGIYMLRFADGQLGSAFWWHDDELEAYEAS